LALARILLSNDFMNSVPGQPPVQSVVEGGTGPYNAIGSEVILELLVEELDNHPLWETRLLRACRLGHLGREDWRFLFSQYYLYSGNFTRLLAAAMAGCPNDYFRARLAQNLWEEGGQLRPEERHTEIFRTFLTEALGVQPETIKYEIFSEHFVQQYLNHCYTGAPAFVSAFLSLGTEGLVARLYGFFKEGLLKAGLVEEQLRFFTLHMDCDDAHAATLTEMMLSYAADPGWEQQVRAGMHAALELRRVFFENVFDAMVRRRLDSLLHGIQDRQALGPDRPRPEESLFRRGGRGPLLYTNTVERLGIQFLVERIPFPAEVLDPRLVYIPPGRSNERHKHAHESIFVILHGEGRVLVGEQHVPVRPGDLVFVPRWVLHQTENQSKEQMILLAITDHGLTGKAFVGDYDRTARLKRVGEAR
jgi:quercetin dioxygenase-like cupin family protein/pyrroloquinoline quinone (PQQ) biosynthesis protein C